MEGDIHRSMLFLRGKILTLDKTHKPSSETKVIFLHLKALYEDSNYETQI